jgi:hypothetical protein
LAGGQASVATGAALPRAQTIPTYSVIGISKFEILPFASLYYYYHTVLLSNKPLINMRNYFLFERLTFSLPHLLLVAAAGAAAPATETSLPGNHVPKLVMAAHSRARAPPHLQRGAALPATVPQARGAMAKAVL